MYANACTEQAGGIQWVATPYGLVLSPNGQCTLQRWKKETYEPIFPTSELADEGGKKALDSQP